LLLEDFRFWRVVSGSTAERRAGWRHMKVNIFRRMVKGRGTMRSIKSIISDTSRRKTYLRNVSTLYGGFVSLDSVLKGLVGLRVSIMRKLQAYEAVVERHIE
jgi:hypothetical protein